MFFFFLFFLILAPFNFNDADERNANVDKKKMKISNPHHPQADCFLSPTQFSFDYQIFGLQTDRQFFHFFVYVCFCFCFCYILNVKQQFKVDTPMQVFPL